MATLFTPARSATIALLFAVAACIASATGQTQQPPEGQVKGTAWQHTKQSIAAAMANAWVALPATATGGAAFNGKLADAPKTLPPGATKVPIVVFAHGSTGINDTIKAWQKWLADDVGVASVTLDSMQLPDRLTYTSPVAKDVYERIHALRAQELASMVAAVRTLAWADPTRMIIAGTSEGAVSVARYRAAEGAPKEIARILYSWSCESNYHVEAPRTAIPDNMPVLNVMSSTDPYFSQSNAWVGNPSAKGHCADALKDNKTAEIVLLPQAPHALFNLPAARGVTKAFLLQVLS
jgi:poly(3-hydroxybutyrate) depolymerase